LIEFEASHALPFSAGVAAGISSWFAILLSLLGHFKERFRRNTLDLVVRVMGIVLAAIGVAAAVRFGIFLASLL
jgi:small neutral amino acid transporter SnatA (MarC family)